MLWMAYAAYVRYGFEGSVTAIYGFNRTTMECHSGYCHYKYPVKFLEQFSMENSVYWVNVVALLAFFVGLRTAGYFVLKYKIRFEK